MHCFYDIIHPWRLEDERMKQPTLKRWTILDTLNASLLIVSILFLINFEEQPLISWLLIAVFTMWAGFLIFRNVVISKAQNDPTHPLNNAVKKESNSNDK